MRTLFASALLLSICSLAACGGATAPNPPATDDPSAEARTAPAATPSPTATAPTAAPAPEAKTDDGATASRTALPTDLDDPTADAECTKPWPSLGGSFTELPESFAASERDVQAQISADGTQLTLTFATSSVSDDAEHGRMRAENQNSVGFSASGGKKFQPGTWKDTPVSTSGSGTECWKGGAVGGSYGGYSATPPKWDLEITSLSASRVEGSYERKLEDGSGTQHVEFSAPIGGAPMGRPMTVCCLK